MPIQQLQRVLTWLGFIPFLFFAVVFLFSNGVWWISTDQALSIYAVYCAVILSFMAGTHWGLVLGKFVPDARITLLWSNLIAVLAWVGVALPFKLAGLSLVLLGFVIQLWLDFGFCRRGIINQEYFRLRLTMTFFVVLSMLPVILRLADII